MFATLITLILLVARLLGLVVAVVTVMRDPLNVELLVASAMVICVSALIEQARDKPAGRA